MAIKHVKLFYCKYSRTLTSYWNEYHLQ